jgi:Tfp pilus assembly protein PilF
MRRAPGSFALAWLLGAALATPTLGADPGLAAYLDGLEALEKAQWPAAAAAFTRAIEAEEENASYYTARGVAHTLAEKFPQALEDLERSLRLRPNHRETRLWLGVAYRMSGNPGQGAMHFTHGKEVPVDYASFVYNEMAMEYLRSTQARRGQAAGAPARGKFPRAGTWFAQRAKAAAGQGVAGGRAASAGQEVPRALFTRAKERYERQEYAGALADLEAARQAFPEDLDVLQLYAWCRLATGDAETARQDFTRVLTTRTGATDAYLSRALASAHLGNSRRTEADLKVAAQLDPKATQQFLTQQQKELDAAKRKLPVGEPLVLAQGLLQAARSSASWQNLVDQAVAVRKAMNARRLRYDERYQEQLRMLEEPTRTIPTSADALAALAAFLYREASVKRERVEPRGPMQLYRYQTPQMQNEELARAEKLCDQALAINANHKRALVTKAAVQMWHLRFEEARPLLKKLIDLGETDDPEVAFQLVTLMEADAARRQAMAAELRRTKLLGTDYYYGYSISYWRHPTQAELRRADELDRQAEDLVKLGLEYLEKVAQVHAGTAAGFFCQAIVHRRKEDPKSAKAALEQAIQQKPDFVDAYFQLAGTCADLGLADAAFDAREKAFNLLQTTAAHRLTQAWGKIDKTMWKTGKEALARALELDPADARGFAYLGVIALAEERPQEALAYFHSALALEEARARLAGTTFSAGGKGARPPDEFGRTVALRLQIGKQLLEQGKPAEALELFRANLEVGSRVDKRDWAVELYSALLPDPSRDASTVPDAPILATALTWSRLHAGDALLALKRPEEAAREYEGIVAFGKGGELATMPGRKGLDEPKAWAAMGLAKLAMARGDRRATRQWLNQSGYAKWGSKEAQAEIRRLEAEYSRRQP